MTKYNLFQLSLANEPKCERLKNSTDISLSEVVKFLCLSYLTHLHSFLHNYMQAVKAYFA